MHKCVFHSTLAYKYLAKGQKHKKAMEQSVD